MKLKNNQSGVAHLAAIALVVVIVVIGFVGWKVWDSSKDSPAPVDTSAEVKVETDKTEYSTIAEWGVRMPVTKVGKFTAAYGLSPSTQKPSAPLMGSSSDKTLESTDIDVTGFTKDENKCANQATYNKNGSIITSKELYYTGVQIYRHKEEDPIITYQGTFNLSKSAPIKVRVNDWWYSISQPETTGSCFEGVTSELPKDYITLTEKLVENFKKLEEY